MFLLAFGVPSLSLGFSASLWGALGHQEMWHWAAVLSMRRQTLGPLSVDLKLSNLLEKNIWDPDFLIGRDIFSTQSTSKVHVYKFEDFFPAMLEQHSIVVPLLAQIT